MIENIKSKDQTIVTQKDQKIAEIQEKATQFQIENEKIAKDLEGLRTENKKLEEALQQNISGSYDDKISEYEKRCNELEEKLQLQ